MAITRVGADVIGASSASGLNIPITAQVGDVTVVFYHSGSQFVGPTTPSGWTLLDNLSVTGNSTYVWYRVWDTAGGSFTQNNLYSTDIVVHYVTYRGVDNVNPIEHNIITDTGTDTTPALALGSRSVDSQSFGAMMANPSTSATRTYTAGVGQTRLTHYQGTTATNYNGGAIMEYTSQTAGSRTLTGSVSAALTNLVYAGVTLRAELPNAAPVINSQPTVAYTGTHAVGSATALTRLGPPNTATVNMLATDTHQTGAGALSYQVRTSATPGAGTLVTSGTMTTGVNPAISLNASMPGITTTGSHTLYVHVLDGEFTTVTNSFVVNVDLTAPSIGTVTPPDPLYGFTGYAITFTPTDAHSTNTNELNWHVRTGSAGTGDLLAFGTATSGTPITTDEFDDPTLAAGDNTRYLRVEDGGGNITETSFTVNYTARVWDQIQQPPTGADDGYWYSTQTASTTGNLTIVGWSSSAANYSSFLRMPLNAESSFQIDYTELRLKVSAVYAGPVTIRVQAVKELNPTAIASGTDWNSRPKTTAYVDWNASDWTAVGKIVRSPDLTPIIEELTSQPGWTAGNNIVLVLSNPNAYVSTTYQRRATSSEDVDVYPQLYIDWTEGEHYVELDGSVDILVDSDGTDLLGHLYNEEGGFTANVAVEMSAQHVMFFDETEELETIGIVVDGVDAQSYSELTDLTVVGSVEDGVEFFTYGHVDTLDLTPIGAVTQATEGHLIAETTVNTTVIGSVLDGFDVYEPFDPGPQTYTELNAPQSVRVVSSYSIEAQQFVYREVNNSTHIGAITSGTDNHIASETFGLTVVRAVSTYSVEFEAFQYTELGGETVIGSVETSGIEHQYFRYTELTGSTLIGVVEDGLDGFIVVDLANDTIIGVVTEGQEFIPVVEVADLTEVLAVTDGFDFFAIGHAEVYLPVNFQANHPYIESVFESINEYQASSFLSTNPYSETTFRVTKQ